jgi:hypothetical protein
MLHPQVRSGCSIGTTSAVGAYAVGFSTGYARSALDPARLQHASRHLIQAGLLPNWSNPTRHQFIQLAEQILEHPSAAFDHRLGTTMARGFAGPLGNRLVVVFVFKQGALAGKVATAIVPSAQQRARWGI